MRSEPARSRCHEARPRVTLILESALASGRNVLKGVVRYAREFGPWRFHHEWRNTDTFYPGWLDQWEGDGFLARVENEAIRDALTSHGVPVVDVLGVLDDPALPLVHVDDRAIAKLAADHLLERGYRDFGYCGLTGVNWSDRRAEGFRSALAERGHTCAVHGWKQEADNPWSWEEAQEDVLRWLRALPKPAGLMLCNDHHGHVILEACQRGGLRVPDEVAVVGVDDDDTFCELFTPPLSSVIPDDPRVGYEAARLLDQMMQGGTWDGQPLLVPPCGVRARRSTDALAVEDASIARAVKLIRERACDGLTIDEIVDQVHVSRSLLQRRFKEALGSTMHEQILRARLDRARSLIEAGDLPLAVVAEQAGFKHQAYMGAVFRKHFGTTPLQYRKYRRPL